MDQLLEQSKTGNGLCLFEC